MMRRLIIPLFLVVLFVASGSNNAFSDAGGTVPGGTVPRATQPRTETKVLVIGDSLTSGLYATKEQNTFVSIVAQRSGYSMARRNASVLRNAIPLWSEVKTWKPDIVILEVGINDANGRQWSTNWKGDYLALVRDMQASGAEVILCTTFWVNIQPDSPIYPIHQSINQDIRAIANETGAGLADLWSATVNCKECISSPSILSYFAPHYHGDSFHPSDIGHAKIADTITGVMFPIKTFLPLVSMNEPHDAESAPFSN